MTTQLTLAARVTTAAVLIMLAAGCADSADPPAGSSTEGSSSANVSGSTDGSTDGAGAPSSEAASTPAQEGTGAESPQPATETGPVLKVASLPVGGSPEVDGARQCVHVNLLNTVLPPGVTISVDEITLNPPDIFSLSGDPCGSEPPCTTSWTWTAETASKQCTVAVTQLSGSTGSAGLVMASTVSCADQGACDQVQSGFGGSGTQLYFTATPVTPTDPVSSSPASDSGGS